MAYLCVCMVTRVPYMVAMVCSYSLLDDIRRLVDSLSQKSRTPRLYDFLELKYSLEM
jgi:hypothetical protein